MTPVGVAGILALALGITEFGDRAAELGYIAILLIVAGDGVFPILPGETAIVAGAVLAASGDLNLFGVIVAGTCGAILGDSCAYWIGRAGQGPIRRFITRMAGAHRLEAAERMVARRGPVLVFVGRFLPGLRIAVNMSCGAGHMAYRKFLFFDALGAVVWTTQAALLGYFIGQRFADQQWVAFAVAIGITVIAGAGIWLLERRQTRRSRADADPGSVASAER